MTKKKTKLTPMNELNIAIFKSVQNNSGLTDIGGYKYYFPKTYGEKIKQYLKSLHVDSKETSKQSLCSASSSARLCTNHHYDDGGKFEVSIHNDVSNVPTKMDYVIENTLCECKCQEIVSKKHDYLRSSYCNSKLFKKFDITNISVEDHKNRKQEVDYKYLKFSLKDLDVDLPGDYCSINFDVKQLLCHLIAIANEHPDKDIKKTLKYEIFKPKQEYIDESPALTNLYLELNEQFKAIINSMKIQNFINHYNIVIEMEEVFVDTIKEHFI